MRVRNQFSPRPMDFGSGFESLCGQIGNQLSVCEVVDQLAEGSKSIFSSDHGIWLRFGSVCKRSGVNFPIFEF